MIDVKFKFGTQDRDFGMTIFRDDENVRLVFFVQLDSGGVLVTEKLSNGKWKQHSDEFPKKELQQAIYDKLASLSVKLLAESRPLSELSSHYLKS